ncbi:sensor histidine kinase [Actibacterium pelagium]|uniref:histidine kinase n=1 Tax=Actibacterium pelagium TaxID=2029103 RepID=A0A917AFJ8_9RHOB|nr:sensor histidine kinase [Actibacterium pelagium]GGE48988.1 sensor histidine kinase [Actibacterium pelagium]
MRDIHSDTTAEVILGDDWVGPGEETYSEVASQRRGRGKIPIKRSPLARKIVIFNIMALIVMISGILYLNPGRDSLMSQRLDTFVKQAELTADVVEASLPRFGPVSLMGGDGVNVKAVLEQITLSEDVEALVFDPTANLVVHSVGMSPRTASRISYANDVTFLSDFLSLKWGQINRAAHDKYDVPPLEQLEEFAREHLTTALIQAETNGSIIPNSNDPTVFSIATPIERRGQIIGALALVSARGEIDLLIRTEREQVLRMFVIALFVSVGLSLVLASTIANPLSDLASAAEVGHDSNQKKMRPSRVRIPDLTARPDEIGRLSSALRGMVTALYDRIDSNEQFAADVAHEIKNPLASLRSAVGTLRLAQRDDQRQKLLDVIEHDVRRLDRLVSDISNASRLDSELVKEEETEFSLRQMLDNLSMYLSEEASGKGVDFITDLPDDPISIQGLEPRLAQVFVNLISNAISFCGEGDAVRIWARKRENRVLVVVEDTGPGIPAEALSKIFNRFYSERPVGQFGNHSGLGLAISKQIVEAHGGVIWAENILPEDAAPGAAPLGARFVVGLPT